ncbi:histone H1-like [Senna tora]|uniref:Histone H1-like n=1 Tax=Senna tora TaxID=362788 RepID=A0A834WFW0_9FABA|nr:histone H1-like [Senna tora]
MVTSAKPKPNKSAMSKKAKSSPAHPPFAEMITDAIVALKERTGSSQYAITKFIEEKHKDLPPTFRKLLLYYLKKMVVAEKLVKVKNSFKLPPTRSAPAKKPVDAKPAKPTTKTAPKSQPKASAKPKVAASRKPLAKPKTTAAKSAKATPKPAKTSAKTSLGKKVAKAAKSMKKAKSVKSPVKKAPMKKAKK